MCTRRACSRPERFLPYDPAISQIRNAWRQQAYYDKTADLVVWSAATTHFLEISALHPDFALGVVRPVSIAAARGSGTTLGFATELLQR